MWPWSGFPGGLQLVGGSSMQMGRVGLCGSSVTSLMSLWDPSRGCYVFWYPLFLLPWESCSLLMFLLGFSTCGLLRHISQWRCRIRF